MGHESIGGLPRTKRWDKVVNQISSFSNDNNNVNEISKQTLQNVRARFENIEHDKGVQSALQLLLTLSFAAKHSDPKNYLGSKGIQLPDDITPLQIAKVVSSWVSKESDSKEYATVAQSAAIDTISEWYNKNKTGQSSLFSSKQDQFEVWRKAANGSGFCELSRLYFSKFTERYLKYFLERAASAKVKSLDQRVQFNKALEKNIDAISHHAFETSKITQSFAAGWFNKYAKNSLPSSKNIEGFLSLAFGKIREELLREQDNK